MDDKQTDEKPTAKPEWTIEDSVAKWGVLAFSKEAQ